MNTSAQSIPVADGPAMEAALARPTSGGPHAGVLVLHEIFGLNDDIRRICGHLAEMGYVALAPNLYSGSGPKVVCLTRVLADSAFARGDSTLTKLDAALTHLGAQPDVDHSRLGVIGFCMGGGFALALAARGGVKVASVNYGPVPKKLESSCPVVGSYGGRDLIYGPHGDRLEQHLERLGVEHDVKTYPAAGHSFLNKANQPAWAQVLPNPMRVGYDPEAASDAWRRIGAFFARFLDD